MTESIVRLSSEYMYNTYGAELVCIDDSIPNWDIYVSKCNDLVDMMYMGGDSIIRDAVFACLYVNNPLIGSDSIKLKWSDLSGEHIEIGNTVIDIGPQLMNIRDIVSNMGMNDGYIICDKNWKPISIYKLKLYFKRIFGTRMNDMQLSYKWTHTPGGAPTFNVEHPL